MKKILFSFLAFAALSLNAATSLFEQIKTNGRPEVGAVILMDANGNSITALTISNAGLSALENNSVVPLKISPAVQVYPLYEASFSATTHTTTTLSLSHAAGSATKMVNPTYRAVRGGTSGIYSIYPSATPPATVAALEGREVVTGASHKTEGPCYQTNGMYSHVRASGTAAVQMLLILEECK